MGQAPAVLPLLIGVRVSGTISLPLTGCFSPFPHGTGTLSVSGEYLALEDGPPSFTQDFTCPELLRIPPGWVKDFGYGAITRYGRTFQTVRLSLPRPVIGGPTTPAGRTRRFGLIPVRSPLLGESRLISFPAGTEMFQFPAFASTHLCIQYGMTGYEPCRVSPFGDLRIKGCLRLPEAYRSLPRPSSLPRAKASTLRPFMLDFHFRLPTSLLVFQMHLTPPFLQTVEQTHSKVIRTIFKAPEAPNREHEQTGVACCRHIHTHPHKGGAGRTGSTSFWPPARGPACQRTTRHSSLRPFSPLYFRAV